MKQQNKYDEFIIANAPYLTSNQLAEELDEHVSIVYAACQRLGVTPIKIGEQQKQFILSHKHWGRRKLGEIMGVCDARIIKLCNELELDLPLEKAEIEHKSISQRLRETWM